MKTFGNFISFDDAVQAAFNTPRPRHSSDPDDFRINVEFLDPESDTRPLPGTTTDEDYVEDYTPRVDWAKVRSVDAAEVGFVVIPNWNDTVQITAVHRGDAVRLIAYVAPGTTRRVWGWGWVSHVQIPFGYSVVAEASFVPEDWDVTETVALQWRGEGQYFPDVVRVEEDSAIIVWRPIGAAAVGIPGVPQLIRDPEDLPQVTVWEVIL